MFFYSNITPRDAGDLANVFILNNCRVNSTYNQRITKKIKKNCKNNLHISKKVSTFAASK